MYEMTFSGTTVTEALKAAVDWIANNEAEAALIYSGDMLGSNVVWTVILYFDKSGGK